MKKVDIDSFLSEEDFIEFLLKLKDSTELETDAIGFSMFYDLVIEYLGENYIHRTKVDSFTIHYENRNIFVKENKELNKKISPLLQKHFLNIVK